MIASILEKATAVVGVLIVSLLQLSEAVLVWNGEWLYMVKYINQQSEERLFPKYALWGPQPRVFFLVHLCK